MTPAESIADAVDFLSYPWDGSRRRRAVKLHEVADFMKAARVWRRGLEREMQSRPSLFDAFL